jgi:hypothetical protein
MPKASKSKNRRPRARHRRTLKRAVVAADARPLNRRIWPSLVAPILDHLLIERVFQLTCVAKLFNDAIPFLSVVEQRGVADNSPDRDKARHVLWQPAVWLRLGRARQVTLAIETPEALLHLAGLATASKRSWEVIDLFCSFQSDVEADGLVAQALSGLADALRHGALPALESLTIHCRGDSNDWTTKLGRRAPPPVDAALAKLCVALPPYLAVTCAVEWTLAPHVCAQVLNDRPEVDVNRSKAYLPSALTTWADAADDSDAAMAILRLLLARGADVRGGDADPSSPLSNVVHNGANRGVEALLAAGSDPDAGRAVGPPLLMGCGVWHDGDVLCPCCWLGRSPAGGADPELPQRRVAVVRALLDAGADPLMAHACAPTLTPQKAIVEHLRTLERDDDESLDNVQGGCQKHHMQQHRHLFANALHDMMGHVTEAVERLARQRGNTRPVPQLRVDADNISRRRDMLYATPR